MGPNAVSWLKTNVFPITWSDDTIKLALYKAYMTYNLIHWIGSSRIVTVVSIWWSRRYTPLWFIDDTTADNRYSIFAECFESDQNKEFHDTEYEPIVSTIILHMETHREIRIIFSDLRLCFWWKMSLKSSERLVKSLLQRNILWHLTDLI